MLLLFIYLFIYSVYLFVFQNGICGWENAHKLVHFSAIQIPQGKSVLYVCVCVYTLCVCVTTYSGLGSLNVIIKNQPLKLLKNIQISGWPICKEKRSVTFKVIWHMHCWAQRNQVKSCGSIGSDALQVFDRESVCVSCVWICVGVFVHLYVSVPACTFNQRGFKVGRVLLTSAFFCSYNETVGLAGAAQFYI